MSVREFAAATLRPEAGILRFRRVAADVPVHFSASDLIRRHEDEVEAGYG